MLMLDAASNSIEQGVVKVLRYAGDAILAEFPSIVSAVETASRIQIALAQPDEVEANENGIRIRIGLNFGEVLQDRGKIKKHLPVRSKPIRYGRVIGVRLWIDAK